MTRKEELIAMRGRDLIELANKLGVKVNASRNSLKESKIKVVERILLAENGEVVSEEPEELESVDSTPLEDAESDSKTQVVEFVRPEKEFDLREFLSGAKYISAPISEYINLKRVMKDDVQIGTVTVLADIVTVTTGEGATLQMHNFPVAEYEAIRAEVG